jgi:hypothetical protein
MGRAEVLGRRELNRALLHRQLLLSREPMPLTRAIEHLVGLQAQAPDAPYLALWSRLPDFTPDQLATLLTRRTAVRAPLLRATLHLVTDRDMLALRPFTKPVLDRTFGSQAFARNIADVDTATLLEAGRTLLTERPRTRAELGPLLAQQWPGRDPTSLAYAITYLTAVVQVPPRGLWRAGGAAAWTTAETWLRRPMPRSSAPETLIQRYLTAFGPATVRDIQTWSGVTRLREVTDRLGPHLRTFRSEDGADLLDLPEAPRPDPDVPAPPRFLAEYDNILLSHADRTRIIPDGRPVPLFPGNGAALGSLLIDGFYQANWRITRTGDRAVLVVEPFQPLDAATRDAVVEEGMRLLGFAAGDAGSHDLRFAVPAEQGGG